MRFRKPNLFVRLIMAVVAITAIIVATVIYNKNKPAAPADPGNPGSSETGSNNESSGSALYAELARLIRNPDSNTDIDGEFTFTAYISDEAEEIEFEEDPGVVYLYQTAWISRSDDYFLLDVKELDAPLEPDQLYTVTAELNGSVYWTEDNEQVNVLDVLAKEAKPYTVRKPEPNQGPAYAVGDATYTIAGAHYTTYLIDRKGIVVYFDFKNGGSTDAAPSMSDLSFYQGDSSQLSTTVLSPKEVDGQALNAGGIADKTYAGKTGRYFALYEAGKDVTEDGDTLWLMRYDDDFALIDEIGIPIAKDLAALQAGE